MPPGLIIFRQMTRPLVLFRNYPIAIVLAIGVVVRFIFLLSYQAAPEWDQLLVDSLFHDRWAASIASGNILGGDAFFRAPLYVYILGGLYAIFGHALLVARIFGHLVGLISICLTYFLAERLFSKRTALTAALIHAVYPIAVYFESELLVDSFFTMLVELTVLLFLVSGEKSRSRWYFITGLVLGLATITRPVILALVPLYIIWVIVLRGRHGRSTSRSLVLVAGMVLIIAPVTIRNALVADDFVLVSSSGGINFFIGNNAEADGLSAAMPQPLGRSWEIQDIRHLAETETGRELSASQNSNYWFRKGLKWIASNKADFARLYFKKLYFCINGFEVSNNRNLAHFSRDFLILRPMPVAYCFIVSLAFVSLAALAGRRELDRQKAFILLFVLLYFLTISFFFINARFRLPVIPYMIIFASHGLGYILSAIRRRRFSATLIAAVICGTGAFIVASSNFYGVRKDSIASGYFNQANYFLYHGNFDKAIELYELTVASDPHYPEANLNLGVAYLKKGVTESAERYFKRELENFPANPKAYGNLASLHYLRGEYSKSIGLADQAISLKPYFAEPYLISLRAYGALNDTAAFEKRLEEALKALRDDSRVHLDAALICTEWKMYDNAIGHLTAAIESRDAPIETDGSAFTYTRTAAEQLKGVRATAAYQLGYIYGMQGRLDMSIRMSCLAISLDSNLAEAYVNLLNAYRLTGRNAEASELALRARSRFPRNQLIKRALDSTE